MLTMNPEEAEQHQRQVLADQVTIMRAIGAEWPPVDESPTPEQQLHSMLITHIARQDRALAEQAGELKELRARLYRREEELREARAVLVLLLTSRVYRLTRLLGRWGGSNIGYGALYGSRASPAWPHTSAPARRSGRLHVELPCSARNREWRLAACAATARPTSGRSSCKS